MRRALFVAALLVAGCSNVRSTPIPSDPSRWDQMADQVKRLSDDDRRKLGAYLVRVGMGSAMSGSKVAVPPGATIGDAIDAQAKFEADQQQEEVKAVALKAKSDAERAAQVKKLNTAATVALTDMKVLPKNYDAGRFSERLAFVYAVENHTAKLISGIKGTVVFRDQFGTEIQRMGLALDEDVAANAMRTISGYGKDINQFMAEDTKLAVTPMSKLKVTFEPEMIVFGDGSRIAAPEVSS